MNVIELNSISKKYGSKKILDQFTLKIVENEILAITGPSGHGKTTILNIIGLLENYDDGELVIDGQKNIKVNSAKATIALREKIGYLFQNFALVDDETVYYNLNLALRYVQKRKKEKNELILKTLKDVGLEGFEKQKVYALSGGEQQRVAIARIILKPCKVILADEPTGSLDEENRDLVLDLLKKLNNMGKTIVLVTHDKFVANWCDRIVNI
jgi:putative ABC transport system ATP-binding protein